MFSPFLFGKSCLRKLVLRVEWVKCDSKMLEKPLKSMVYRLR